MKKFKGLEPKKNNAIFYFEFPLEECPTLQKDLEQLTTKYVI